MLQPSFFDPSLGHYLSTQTLSASHTWLSIGCWELTVVLSELDHPYSLCSISVLWIKTGYEQTKFVTKLNS